MRREVVADIVADRTSRNPRFLRLVADAGQRQKLARRLANLRKRRALSQVEVAARMGTSASEVQKLEAGADVKVSTIQRYCAAIGKKISVLGWIDDEPPS